MSCPDCFSGSVHTHATSRGTISTVHGERTYIANGGGGEGGNSKSTIIYLPDAFSLKLVNNLILADRYAAATGCRVLIPDLPYGHGMDPWVMGPMSVLLEPLASRLDVLGALWKVVTLVCMLPYAVPWLLFGHPQRTYPRALAFARAVRKELPAGGKLGVAGFCWGGWPATKLCAETVEEEDGGERLVDAHFSAHPSYMVDTPEMAVEAITKHSVPYAVAVAELDFQFNAAVAERTEAKVREVTASGGAAQGEGRANEGYIYDFKYYKGCKHGFAVRAQEDSVNIDGYQEAVRQAIEWFRKYLN